MDDEEFLGAFEDTTLEPFHHRDHLRVTYLYLRQFGEEGTRERLGPAILRYAEARNGAHLYHETITCAWIALVADALRKEQDFEKLLEEHPRLLDKKLLERYYSLEVLQSPEARAGFMEPDLAPLRANR